MATKGTEAQNRSPIFVHFVPLVAKLLGLGLLSTLNSQLDCFGSISAFQLWLAVRDDGHQIFRTP